MRHQKDLFSVSAYGDQHRAFIAQASLVDHQGFTHLRIFG